MGGLFLWGCLIEEGWAIFWVVLFGCAGFSWGYTFYTGVSEGLPLFGKVEILHSYIDSDGVYIHVQHVSHAPT